MSGATTMNGSSLPDDPATFLREVQRRDFLAFLDRAWPHISGGDYLATNWHIDAIAHQLDRIERSNTRRLLVNLPPRNGKSNTVSVIWIAWMLGRDPTLRFVCVSYSNELSGKLARDCLAIMQSAWYRELFPRTVVSMKRSAAYDFETTRGGGRLATSVTGSLTGRGGDIIILDDVIKPDEASSDTVRETVNNWFRSTLTSRLDNKNKGAIICVMQRLHQFDLSGMLLEACQWEHLSLPAIATEDAIIPLTRGRVHHRKAGDVLHPEREPLEVLEELRASMGSTIFAAQYQQGPIPAHGNMVKAEWFRIWSGDPPAERRGQIVQSWDTASKDGLQNDWSVCITAMLVGSRICILDVFRARLTFPELKLAAIRLARQHRPIALLIEDQASGTQLIQTLRAEKPAGVPPLIARKPESDKVTRLAGVSPMIEAGELLLPIEAPWLADFRQELLAFPSGRYDDQVDALSQLLAWVRDRLRRQPPPAEGGEVISITGMADEDFFSEDDPDRFYDDDDPDDIPLDLYG